MAFINAFKFGDIGVLPSPSGPLGSKTNPYKINKPAQGYNVYIPENTPESSYGYGEITIPRGAKIYFEIDPVTIASGLIGSFKFQVKFFEGAGTVCKLTQDKIIGGYSLETCVGSDGYLDMILNPSANMKYLYALVGSPDGDIHEGIWITITPYIESGVVVQPPVTSQVEQIPTQAITPVQITPTPTGGDIMATYDPYADFLRARGVSETEISTLLAARAAQEAQVLPSQVGVSSIMAGFPTWAWIVIAGIGVTMLLRRGKQKVS